MGGPISDDGKFDAALVGFEEVGRLARGRPELHPLANRAAGSAAEVRETLRIRAEADEVAAAALPLKARLADPAAPVEPLALDVAHRLAPFRVLHGPGWAREPILTFLDEGRRRRLVRDADELLFALAARSDPADPAQRRRAVELCDLALGAAPGSAPWLALRGRFAGPGTPRGADPAVEASATACFEWAALAALDGKAAEARAWLMRAVTLEPADPWYRLALARCLAATGDPVEARAQYEAAAALRPADPMIRRDRDRFLGPTRPR